MDKEKLKVNKVEAPTLFIGVGGAGSDIVKRVAEMCRHGETENINFVCLDTNVNDLSGIKKSEAKIHYVQTSNTQTVGDYLSYDEDARKAWFPKNAVIYDKTVSEGAGQVRAISRLALNSTIKTGAIKPLYEAIDELFRKDGRDLKQALRIVMVSSASGGTGSGIILPLAMFIRDHVKAKYPNTSLIVRSMLLLPETLDSVIDSSVERESQRRNAYATIKEINAFMMKGSGFLDVDSDMKRYGNLHIDFPIPGTDEMKSLGILPFDFCFLMDGQDAEDTTMVTLEQYKQQAARALYEQNIGPMQKNAFSVEDNIIKEMSNPGNLGRNRFGAIGASVIRYPYEKITEYVAYDWAIDSVGGEGEATKWARYDKAFELKRQEGRKKGLAESEMPKRSEVYVDTMKTSSDTFSKDIRGKYLSEADKAVRRYIQDFEAKIMGDVMSNRDIKTAQGQANELSMEIDYKNNTDARGKAGENLDSLRNFHRAVQAQSAKQAEGIAEAIFYNDKKTINARDTFSLEYLMKNGYGEVSHPTAMRYLLYMVLENYEKKIKELNSLRSTSKEQLDVYSPDAAAADIFDFKYARKRKSSVNTIDDLCALEKEDPSVKEKMMGYEEIYDLLNTNFQGYYGAIMDYAKAEALYTAYRIGYEYVQKLCAAFEGFFSTFRDRVETLTRKKGDLVDELSFRKGDSVYNVCSSQELLDELSKSTKAQSAEGALLDSEANADIFDAIRKNVEFEREIQSMDIVEEDQRVDIFDDVLVGYFKKAVRSTCKSLDANIIEALALEQRLSARLKSREDSGDGEKIFDKVTREDSERHINEVVEMGRRLAAPSIQRMRNVESREIALCAYNKSLLDMRTFRIKDLLPKGNAVDSVSKYELCFFNALYNLTPDKLNKFAAPRTLETTKRRSGLYYNAYVEYAKDIGPDSTKGAKISTHIDKRWDAISVMPEMDLDHQANEMLRVHQAVIYGLVYKAIQHVRYSMMTEEDKKVYKYRNSDERFVTLSVSNNTPCDEFYEVVDSMYISSFVASDIEVIKTQKAYKDKAHHAKYATCQFKKFLDEFVIEECHNEQGDKTSLFEIPVYYYASLPNSKRFDGELSAMVDAVIKTFEDELMAWEDKDDVKFMLCRVLQEQFDIMMKNYAKYASLNAGLSAANNPVVDMIMRKIQAVVESTPEPSDYISMIEKMKQKIK